jgi:hypothetical protein
VLLGLASAIYTCNRSLGFGEFDYALLTDLETYTESCPMHNEKVEKATVDLMMKQD